MGNELSEEVFPLPSPQTRCNSTEQIAAERIEPVTDMVGSLLYAALLSTEPRASPTCSLFTFDYYTKLTSSIIVSINLLCSNVLSTFELICLVSTSVLLFIKQSVCASNK